MRPYTEQWLAMHAIPFFLTVSGVYRGRLCLEEWFCILEHAGNIVEDKNRIAIKV